MKSTSNVLDTTTSCPDVTRVDAPGIGWNKSFLLTPQYESFLWQEPVVCYLMSLDYLSFSVFFYFFPHNRSFCYFAFVH